MELLIAILLYCGIIDPTVASTSQTSQLSAIAISNQALIQTVMSDPIAVQAVGDLTIDRRED
jgi:hypothetical protein